MRAIAREPGASAHALAVATFYSDQSFGTLADLSEEERSTLPELLLRISRTSLP